MVFDFFFAAFGAAEGEGAGDRGGGRLVGADEVNGGGADDVGGVEELVAAFGWGTEGPDEAFETFLI